LLIETLADMMVRVDPDLLDAGEFDEARLQLFGALVEATENTRLHAYPVDWEDPESVRRWWMTGAVDAREKRLTLIVYDQGMSIPASLPKWAGYAQIEAGLRRLFRNRDRPHSDSGALDAISLRFAMAIRRSSSGLENRGKGLHVFKDVIDRCRDGKLRIISRRGEFVYEKGRRPRATLLATPLPGTLVEWDLKL
jgi:hypothetical protein